MKTLREVRQVRGLVLQALAVRAHTSPATLVAIERYGHRPGPELQTRIAEALGVPREELWPEKAAEVAHA